MNFSCGSDNCMCEWICNWCKNTYCDDICLPNIFKGKPEQNNVKKELSNNQIMTKFFLCKDCLNKYTEHNVCKGRKKIKFNKV